MDNNHLEDITPDGCPIPIFLDTREHTPPSNQPTMTPEQFFESQAAHIKSAKLKLIKLGLTTDEAAALLGS